MLLLKTIFLIFTAISNNILYINVQNDVKSMAICFCNCENHSQLQNPAHNPASLMGKKRLIKNETVDFSKEKSSRLI